MSDGNGAREVVLDWLNGPPVAEPGAPDFMEMSADSLLAFLWAAGFAIVPLENTGLVATKH